MSDTPPLFQIPIACTCGHLVPDDPSSPYNWNPDCKAHGVESFWFNSPEQVALREQRVANVRSKLEEMKRNRG